MSQPGRFEGGETFLALALCACTFIFVPSAAAAPPANNDFANGQSYELARRRLEPLGRRTLRVVEVRDDGTSCPCWSLRTPCGAKGAGCDRLPHYESMLPSRL
jgi:hypothetical protein